MKDEKVLCPNCGGRSELNSRFCIFCGKEIKKRKEKKYHNIPKKETKKIEEIELLDEPKELKKKESQEEPELLEEYEIPEMQTEQEKNIGRFVLSALAGITVLVYIFCYIVSNNSNGMLYNLMYIILFIFILAIIMISVIYLKFPKSRKIISNILKFLKYLSIILLLAGLIFYGPCIGIIPFIGI